jgi:hypothetical protein
VIWTNVIIWFDRFTNDGGAHQENTRITRRRTGRSFNVCKNYSETSFLKELGNATHKSPLVRASSFS